MIKFSNFFTTFRVIYVGMKNVSMFFVVIKKIVIINYSLG